MKPARLLAPALLLLLLLLTSRAIAQNVSGYAALPEPLLFLLREPAVHEDLGLNDAQRRKLIAFNESVDGDLLASRNQPPEASQKRFADVLARTRELTGQLLTPAEQQRLQQITCRLRGLPFVLQNEAAERLALTGEQRREIEAIVNETNQKIGEVLSPTFQGQEAHQRAQQAIMAAQQSQHKQILEALDADQKQTLLDLVGRPFDVKSLGHVVFKAPELAAGDSWVNSQPLKLADVRGKVVALNFWAFGCSNCMANYPWYRQWNEEFAGQDFLLVGVHTPETPAEQNAESVRQKVSEAGLNYPIVIDNEKRNWNAWGNSMWPSLYLIDKQGRLRYWWYGELNWNGAGGQRVMADKIRELLAEEPAAAAEQVSQ